MAVKAQDVTRSYLGGMLKHKRHHSRPFEGRIKLGPYSGLRKLARAMRRGKLDDERARLIQQTEDSAAQEPEDKL